MKTFALTILLVVLNDRGFAMVPVANNEVMSFAQVSEPRKRSLNGDSGHIDVEIAAFGETRQLELIPREFHVFASNFQGFVSNLDERGNPVIQNMASSKEAQDDLHSKLFTDSTGSASLYVERRNGHILLEGILDHETRITNNINRQGRSLDESVHHKVYKHVTTDQGTCHLVASNLTRTVSERNHLGTRQLPDLVQPEVLLHIDYTTSKFHNFDVEAIKKYIAIFFYSVNRYFATIDDPKIVNVVTAIIITRHDAEQPFVIKNHKAQVYDSPTLQKFGEFLYSNRENLTDVSYDIAIWITGLDLVGLIKGKWEKNVKGLAMIAGVCYVSHELKNNSNVGLAEDKPGTYSGIRNVVHEMGHLYGALHDGDPGAESCSFNDGYVMSYVQNSSNTFYFSPCSITLIKRKLSSPSGSCMLNIPKVREITDKNVLPGTLRSLDDQCKDIFGNYGAFDKRYLSVVCIHLHCIDEKWYFNTQTPALEGSRCGDNKVCIRGECVSSISH